MFFGYPYALVVQTTEAGVNAAFCSSSHSNGHPEATGRPAYQPATLPKIYGYGYVNRIQSSRRLERETQRSVSPGSRPGHWRRLSGCGLPAGLQRGA